MIFADGHIIGTTKVMELLGRYEKTSGQVMNKMKTKSFLRAMSYTRRVAIIEEFGVTYGESLRNNWG